MTDDATRVDNTPAQDATMRNRKEYREFVIALADTLCLRGLERDFGIMHPYQNLLPAVADLLTLRLKRDAKLRALSTACAIIEAADERNLANDGPAGGCPPQLTLAEWRTLYTTLDEARR